MPRKKLDELAFTLRVYRESVQKLDYIAGANGRSRNSEINQAIKQYIAAMKGKTDRSKGQRGTAEGKICFLGAAVDIIFCFSAKISLLCWNL